MTLSNLFGETLRSHDGKTVSTNEALADKDAIGIYFSAHWCPPCRGFTPQLATSYKEIVQNKKFEIVFVSSDHDDKAFEEYHHEMPWLAVPFEDKQTAKLLNKKFKVQGIPTFVIVDGKGETITTEGRGAISKDPHGQKFPWVPPTLMDSLGDKLVHKDGSEVSVKSVFESSDAVGIYFSAHWCPPCRGFTPNLVNTYNSIKEAGKHNFEVIFVSSDKDKQSFDEYFGEMPWLALPYEDRDRKGELSEVFGVEGIPTFVIVDKNGKTINASARGCVSSDPQGLEFPWAPKPVNPISSPDGINETPSVVLFVEKADEQTKTLLHDALTSIATETIGAAKAKGEDASLLFFWANEESGVGSRVRQLASAGEATSEAQVVILDIPDDGGLYTLTGEVTKESLHKFVTDFASGSLKDQRKQLAN
eukprot:c8902_g1_i1.p1 GENE.c8902_g1_i1~~c8902_g1_i1.p1  ORF type:complete len:458 (+),score=135.90 c8902_g1_i1:115-1374(+)